MTCFEEIGDSPRPLHGITVVDLTRYVPGPYCTRLLADLGASVVKVEPPQGDPLRGFSWYELLNHGKRIVTLDLREPHGRAELAALLGQADVCLEGFKPATAREIGVDGAALAARHPSLVHCSISGYGQTGAQADKPAHDLNYQADAGLLGARPQVPELLVADITGALHAAIAILAALVARRGATIDIALVAAARSWTPFMPPPVLRGEYACYNVYQTGDGGWIALAALEPKFWERFCRHVQRHDWISLQFCDDPRRREILCEVSILFRSRSTAEWTRELEPLDCCFSSITKT